MSTRVVLTYRDLETLPEDGRRYELYEGELAVPLLLSRRTTRATS